MGFQRSQPLMVPAFGVIKGGRLDGWRFHFLQFVATSAELLVLARCSAPNWPFPCDIPLNTSHFMQLRAARAPDALAGVALQERDPMTIVPITSTTPACYGIACPKHGACARYHAVEQTSPDHTQATCDDGKGGRPMFVEIADEEA